MLKTEMRNPASMHLDRMDTLSMLRLINRENARAVEAVEEALPAIARAVDAVTAAFRREDDCFTSAPDLRPAGGGGCGGMPSHLRRFPRHGGGDPGGRRAVYEPGRARGKRITARPAAGICSNISPGRGTWWWGFPPPEARPMCWAPWPRLGRRAASPWG